MGLKVTGELPISVYFSGPSRRKENQPPTRTYGKKRRRQDLDSDLESDVTHTKKGKSGGKGTHMVLKDIRRRGGERSSPNDPVVDGPSEPASVQKLPDSSTSWRQSTPSAPSPSTYRHDIQVDLGVIDLTADDNDNVHSHARSWTARDMSVIGRVGEGQVKRPGSNAVSTLTATESLITPPPSNRPIEKRLDSNLARVQPSLSIAALTRNPADYLPTPGSPIRRTEPKVSLLKDTSHQPCSPLRSPVCGTKQWGPSLSSTPFRSPKVGRHHSPKVKGGASTRRATASTSAGGTDTRRRHRNNVDPFTTMKMPCTTVPSSPAADPGINTSSPKASSLSPKSPSIITISSSPTFIVPSLPSHVCTTSTSSSATSCQPANNTSTSPNWFLPSSQSQYLAYSPQRSVARDRLLRKATVGGKLVESSQSQTERELSVSTGMSQLGHLAMNKTFSCDIADRLDITSLPDFPHNVSVISTPTVTAGQDHAHHLPNSPFVTTQSLPNPGPLSPTNHETPRPIHTRTGTSSFHSQIYSSPSVPSSYAGGPWVAAGCSTLPTQLRIFGGTFDADKSGSYGDETMDSPGCVLKAGPQLDVSANSADEDEDSVTEQESDSETLRLFTEIKRKKMTQNHSMSQGSGPHRSPLKISRRKIAKLRKRLAAESVTTFDDDVALSIPSSDDMLNAEFSPMETVPDEVRAFVDMIGEGSYPNDFSASWRSK